VIITHGDKCDAKWSGLRVEHCPACHETFTGTEAGDAHRIVQREDAEGNEYRRCLTANEMRSLKRRDSEPWFVEGANAYGTRLWSRNRPGRVQNPAWITGVRDSEALAA
jgi:hypothetical protein